MKHALPALLFIITSFGGGTLNAQHVNWNTEPQTGFVFRITNKEAQRLLTKSRPDTIVKEMLHTQVDTYDVSKGWTNKPDKGHFILARIIENQLHCEYTSVFPYQVLLLKEYDALSLQVLDSEGNIREDARVRFRTRRIPIDPLTKTYRVENEWFNRKSKFVTVELDGFRSVFNIDKHEVPEWSHRSHYDDEGPDFYSYMITDKNRYKPGERVRFKSYALTGSRFPVKKDLQVTLWHRGRPTRIGMVSPHRPGSFTGEIHLHDSLKLLLDQQYNLQLSDKRGRVIANCNFRYEDYELNGNKLNIELEASQQYHPASNILKIFATDENGLILKDARATISVLTHSVNEIFTQAVTLPDTLMRRQITLNPDEPTRLEIPSSIFREANVTYLVRVDVLNTQNEKVEDQVAGTHFYSQYELSTSFSHDSIVYELTNNGEVMHNAPATIYRDSDINGKTLTLPHREKINPAVRKVTLKSDFVSRSFIVANLSPTINISGGITKDSFNIAVDNPQRLQLSWYVYQGSMLLAKGFGADVEFKSKIEDFTNSYHVELLYSLGGSDHVRSKEFKIRKNGLHVDVDLPDRIYPGQKVDATIKVTDIEGLPVGGVDLTAFATTAKLDYFVSDLPYYGEVSTPRAKGTTFEKHDLTKYTAILDLDYKRWAKPAGLDTMKYYQFIYPQSKFVYEATTSDSTQFAIFLMKNGIAKEVHVMEVDRKPVYYSWSNQPAAYSFYAEADKNHEVSLRLRDRVIILNSVCFSEGKKTVMSLDLDHLPPGVDVFKFKPKKIKRPGMFGSVSKWSFTTVEAARHKNFIAAFQETANPSYLTSGKDFIPLSREGKGSHKIIVGPVTPGMHTYVEEGRTQTTYRHAGGFSYVFEDNIVYKSDVSHLIPDELRDNTFRPASRMNDEVIKKEIFLRPEKLSSEWHPSVIHLIDGQCRVKILLPYEEAQSGVASVLFENCKTHDIVVPCRDYSNVSDFMTIPRGCYNTIVVYENGKYFKAENTELKSFATLVVDMNHTKLRDADANANEWLLKKNKGCMASSPPVKTLTLTTTRTRHGNVRGQVFSVEDNSPLPGVNVVVKGTSYGTVTDANGAFLIHVSHDPSTLVFTFIGLMSMEVEVSPGTQVDIMMESDITQLSEVVVTAYGFERSYKSLGYSMMLSGRVAGVQIDQSDDEKNEGVPVSEEEQRQAEETLYNELLNLKTIRSNFNDVAFWEPKLFTDRNGQSTFTVLFPDDITRWDAVVYAMNRRLQTGTARRSIRSYKPLMTQLHVPRFLTVGDSAEFTGKVLNYTSEKTINGTVAWNGTSKGERPITFESFYSDKFPVVASSADSVDAGYSFTRNDGYFDGEQRKVPVVEQGTVRAEGTIALLQNDDHVHVTAKKGELVNVEIVDNAVAFYSQDVRYLLHYKYDCNEQLASKLIGLVNAKLIAAYEGKSFDYDKDVNRIIARLLKNQNEEFLWSWWDVSVNTSYWMSMHILRALKAAKDAGYVVNLDISNVMRKATYKYDFLDQVSLPDIELMHALALWGADIDYPRYLARLEKIVASEDSAAMARGKKYRTTPRSVLKERLLLMEIRQLRGIQFVRDSLLRYKKSTVLNEVYFDDNRPVRDWYSDELMNNAIAYRIVSRDSVLKDMRGALQMYFISKRKKDGWNTYETSNVLMSVLPDLIAIGARKTAPATIALTGKVELRQTKFPYTLTLSEGEVLDVKKESGMPLYFMAYHEERVTEARAGTDAFTIKTMFDDRQLQAGKPVLLTTEIKLKRDAKLQHVMIEIPIPAGCSYADKRSDRYETHREYFKEKVVIFCEAMAEGTYRFDVNLLPRFTGSYHVNPAQVSLMYFPVVNANTAMEKVSIGQ